MTPLRGARDRRRVRAPRPDAPRARAGHRRQRGAARAPPASAHLRGLPRDGPSPPRLAPAQADRVRVPRSSRRRARSSSGCAAAVAPAAPAASELHPMEQPAESRRAVPAAQRRRLGRPADRTFGRRRRRPALDGPDQPPRLGRDRAPAPPELRPRDRRPRSQHRRRRPDHVHRRPDRDLRQRRRRRDLLRRHRAPPGPEARDPQRVDGRAKRKPTRDESTGQRCQARPQTSVPSPCRSQMSAPTAASAPRCRSERRRET